MLTVLVLTLASLSGPMPDLSGTWDGDNGATLVVRANEATLTGPDGIVAFRMTLSGQGNRIRATDRYGVIPGRLDGERMILGEVEYRRRPFAQSVLE